jgi:hypothetical protein
MHTYSLIVTKLNGGSLTRSSATSSGAPAGLLTLYKCTGLLCCVAVAVVSLACFLRPGAGVAHGYQPSACRWHEPPACVHPPRATRLSPACVKRRKAFLGSYKRSMDQPATR